MDSDDDADDQEESGDGGEKVKEDEDPPPDDEDDERRPVTVQGLEEVQSFGRMMLLAPALRGQLRASSLGPEEVAAACRALGRTRFFDRELLDDLYGAINQLLQGSQLGPALTADAVQCMKTLNAYSQDVCSAIARSYMGRVGDLEASMRAEWLEIFTGFGHRSEPGFLQLLEVPPVPPIHPNYKKVRCRHHSRGHCAIGEAACTWSHDPRAPLSLTDGTKEDWWRCKASIMMTQNQKCMGNGSYGTGPLGVNPH